MYAIAKFVRQEPGDRPEGDPSGDPGRVDDRRRGERAVPPGAAPPRRGRQDAASDGRPDPASSSPPTCTAPSCTFRKFLAAASFYEVDALVFGGDLMGKAFVPIVRRGRRVSAPSFRGEDQEFERRRPRGVHAALVERTGFYWQVMDRDEYDAATPIPCSSTVCSRRRRRRGSPPGSRWPRTGCRDRAFAST